MLKLTESNYYSLEAAKAYCSSSQYKSFIGYPLQHGCEARAMAEINGEWKQEISEALLIGSILDSLWEGATPETLLERFPECISTRGRTKGQLKTEFQQAINLFKRTSEDEEFCKYMSGEKQVIMTGEIEGLPFKIKIDSFIDGVCITDLKTTRDVSMDFRYYIPDTGQKLPFYIAWGYDTQLAIYREIVRQNTGKTLRCYIAAVDKKPHPLPAVIELLPKILDDRLKEVRMNAKKIIMLKNGEIKNLIRCESCDYCRDTHKVKLISNEEFETHEVQGD